MTYQEVKRLGDHARSRAEHDPHINASFRAALLALAVACDAVAVFL